MASNKFVYFMDGVSKTYPGGKKVFEKIRLNFLPGVKIGVVGVNGRRRRARRISPAGTKAGRKPDGPRKRDARCRR